jgi:mannose-6-phosphate isomerase-like protein (cupin superfamily)
LIETIDKTIQHLKGTRKMKSKEMFVGFSVAAGEDRFNEKIKLGGEPIDCKVSAKDTEGAVCVFEYTGGGWPRHLHHDLDEWIYVIDGDLDVRVGDKRLSLGAGESVFLPRKVGHVWGCPNGKPAKIINVYQPAGKMEEFFREVGKFNNPPIHEALSLDEFKQFFENYGMKLLGPPLGWDEYLARKPSAV